MSTAAAPLDPWGRSVVYAVRRWVFIPILLAALGAVTGGLVGTAARPSAEALVSVRSTALDGAGLERAAESAALAIGRRSLFKVAGEKAGADPDDLRSRTKVGVKPGTQIISVTVTAGTSEQAVGEATAVAVAAVQLGSAGIPDELDQVTEEVRKLIRGHALANPDAERARLARLGDELATRQGGVLANGQQLTLLQEAEPARLVPATPVLVTMGAPIERGGVGCRWSAQGHETTGDGVGPEGSRNVHRFDRFSARKIRHRSSDGLATLEGVEGDGHRRCHLEIESGVGDCNRVSIPDRLLTFAGHDRLTGRDVNEVEVEHEWNPDVANHGEEIPDPAEDGYPGPAFLSASCDSGIGHLPGRADQTLGELLLEVADDVATGIEHVVFGVDVKSLAGFEREQSRRFGRVGVEDHFFLERHSLLLGKCQEGAFGPVWVG